MKNQKPAPKCTMILSGSHLQELLPHYAAHFELGFGPLTTKPDLLLLPPPSPGSKWIIPVASYESQKLFRRNLLPNFDRKFHFHFFFLHIAPNLPLYFDHKFCILFLSCFANLLLNIDLNSYVLLPAP